ncbi:ABC transporter permease [Clostridium fungisolvens]|uniref:ABC-2 family transporter protein n=1 Tax=Clostridium fungisolvens TaxID=1604897 RepID=A0A6V8SGT2_9CLOT|nr:ABC transporter permease [Clostridium fungisolvens]GFP74083.1 hypothetical protein bsdtw1_00122 [Clostridium fungisolvens]
MYNLIIADLFKIRKSKSIKVLFGITTLSAVTMVTMAYLIQQGKIDKTMNGIGFLFSDVNMMSILGATIAAIFICGDFDNKIIHEAIATGNSRITVLFGKIIVFCCSLLFILLPYIIAVVIAMSTGCKFSMGSVGVGFLNLLTVEAGKSLSEVVLWKLVAAIVTLIIIYLSQLSICIPLALVIKKPVLVVVIYYGFTILSAQLVRLGDNSKVFHNILACTPYGGSYSFVVSSTAYTELFKAICASFMFMAVMFTIAYLGFRKSEIK